MFNRNKIQKKQIEEMQAKISKALDIAWAYGQVDGSHHKMWVIDQMVRILCGSTEEYADWVMTYETPLSDEDYYIWDMGIAP